MSTARKRTVSVDLPDALVRRAARHVGPQGGFGTVIEQALALWLDSKDAEDSAESVASSATEPAIPSSREVV